MGASTKVFDGEDAVSEPLHFRTFPYRGMNVHEYHGLARYWKVTEAAEPTDKSQNSEHNPIFHKIEHARTYIDGMLSRIKLSDLGVLQTGLRKKPEEMGQMLHCIRMGGRFNHETMYDFEVATKGISEPRPLIAINIFEDGSMFVRDGLHRVVAIQAARKEKVLYPDEYEIERLPYVMYQKINVYLGWYTPFNPQDEVRLSDFMEFKNEVSDIVMLGNNPESFIISNRDRFCTKRLASHNLAEIAKPYEAVKP